MIRFIGNQFGYTDHERRDVRVRSFVVEEIMVKSAGSILACRESGLLRVVLFTPPAVYDLYDEKGDDIVNNADRAATHIAGVLRLGSEDSGLIFP